MSVEIVVSELSDPKHIKRLASGFRENGYVNWGVSVTNEDIGIDILAKKRWELTIM